MCCCDGLFLSAFIEAEKARQAQAAETRCALCENEVSSYHDFESTAAASNPIEQDHSIVHTALAFCARLFKWGAVRHVSEAPQR